MILALPGLSRILSGIVVTALVLADLAYPAFDRAHVIATVHSSEALLHLIFGTGFTIFFCLLWCLGVTLDLSTICRVARGSSPDRLAATR
ncbi:MAG: hypothetical protein ACREFD_03985 [Stellaceae bacterium]